MKDGIVILSNPLLGERPYSLEHAERILFTEKIIGVNTWTIFDKKLKLNSDGKIVPATNQGFNNNTEEQK